MTMEIISLKMNNITKVENIFPKAGKNKLRITSSIQAGKSNNFYEVLSLCSENNNVGINDIKRAYRCMALQYHPDVCHDHSNNKEESTKRFIELQKAYETLSDPILRENYDYELSLRDSKGTFGRKSTKNGKIVHKDVWERQLNGLRRRSLHRMEKKRSN
ncbi:hypothetical protein RND71_025617 [Anisodus tanguticus]|uniref:J domain-containing protein n=1 Tax=Anisodus tanguticus TaxID=243964 RepID=A0AAE1RTA3_9SOLA|nr:hypothetical protein RND71_025617 [Anisodus tanguticus]